MRYFSGCYVNQKYAVMILNVLKQNRFVDNIKTDQDRSYTEIAFEIKAQLKDQKARVTPPEMKLIQKDLHAFVNSYHALTRERIWIRMHYPLIRFVP